MPSLFLAVAVVLVSIGVTFNGVLTAILVVIGLLFAVSAAVISNERYYALKGSCMAPETNEGRCFTNFE